MNKSKLHLAAVVIQEIGPTYRDRKSTLNNGEKALYEMALKVSIRALGARGQVKTALEEFDAQLSDWRAKAENARAMRAANKVTEPPVLKQAAS